MESDVIKALRRYRRRWFLVAGVVLGGGAVGAAAVALFLYRRSQRLRYEGAAFGRGPQSGYPQVPEAEDGEDDVRTEALRRRIEETRERLRQQMAEGAAPAGAEAEPAGTASAEDEAQGTDQACAEPKAEAPAGAEAPAADESAPAGEEQTPEPTPSSGAADEGAAPA